MRLSKVILIIQKHLAVARAVDSGGYRIVLDNFLNLTLNVRLTGQPTDFWLLDTVSQQSGLVGISSSSFTPKATFFDRTETGRGDVVQPPSPRAVMPCFPRSGRWASNFSQFA